MASNCRLPGLVNEAKFGSDCLEDGFGLFKDITIIESDDCDAHGSHVFVPQMVLLSTVPGLVLDAVDFDDEFGFMAIEVGNVVTDRFLAVEAVTSQLL